MTHRVADCAAPSRRRNGDPHRHAGCRSARWRPATATASWPICWPCRRTTATCASAIRRPMLRSRAYVDTLDFEPRRGVRHLQPPPGLIGDGPSGLPDDSGHRASRRCAEFGVSVAAQGPRSRLWRPLVRHGGAARPQPRHRHARDPCAEREHADAEDRPQRRAPASSAKAARPQAWLKLPADYAGLARRGDGGDHAAELDYRFKVQRIAWVGASAGDRPARLEEAGTQAPDGATIVSDQAINEQVTESVREWQPPAVRGVTGRQCGANTGTSCSPQVTGRGSDPRP